MESIKIHHIKEILNEHYKNKNPDLLLCRTTIGKIYDVLYPMPNKGGKRNGNSNELWKVFRELSTRS